MNCSHCGRLLNESIYKDDMKSCPRCSQANGQFHVFHPFPSDFGTTPLRASNTHPEGPQSHCQSCRGGNPPRIGTLCKDL